MKRAETLYGNKRWDVNDFAFLEFAKRKGFRNREIASAMGRSESSVAQRVVTLMHWDKGRIAPTDRLYRIVNKAMQLAFAVKSNPRGDQHTQWMKKLQAERGIEYNIQALNEDGKEIPPEQVVQTMATELPEATEAIENTVSPSEDAEYTEEKPLFSINVNVGALVRIIKAIKGN